MNRNAVVLALMRAGLYSGAWVLDDDDYDPVSSGFVAQAWEAWVESLPPELRTQADAGGSKTITVPKWSAEVWDCDNLAADFAVFLSRCMAVDAVKTGKPRGNFAGGRLNFSPTPTTGHCVNWFCDYDGNAHVFDAGNCTLDGLTPTQRLSISAGETI